MSLRKILQTTHENHTQTISYLRVLAQLSDLALVLFAEHRAVAAVPLLHAVRLDHCVVRGK